VLLALAVVLFAVVAVVAVEPASDEGAPGVEPAPREPDSGLAVLVPLIAASASLIGALATLMTSFVTLWKLREESRKRSPPPQHG
jgi:hypothetical protein